MSIKDKFKAIMFGIRIATSHSLASLQKKREEQREILRQIRAK
jgi:hypothetical protein